MTTQKYEKTALRFEVFHTVEAVAEYVNNRDDIADIIAADYALGACEDNGYGFSKEEAEAHLEFLADAGAKFDKSNALDLFEQAVAQKD
jgi:hypothetical protein